MVRLVSRSRYPNNKKFGRGSGRGYDLGFRILSLNQFVRRFIVTMIIIIVIILVFTSLLIPSRATTNLNKKIFLDPLVIVEKRERKGAGKEGGMRRKYCEGGRRKRGIEILSDGVPRLCRIREENANWRTLAKLLYNRQPWRNNEPCIGEPSAAPSPLYLSLSLTSLLPASGERVTFALWPGKRGGGGKKSCIHLHRLRELEEGEVWRRPTSDIVAG